MIKQLPHLIGVAAFLLVSGNTAQASNFQDVTLGGVNLTAWCQKRFGNGFKAKLIANNAGGWACERTAGNRRPISVKNACKLQYGNRSYKAKAVNWSNPYSWKCIGKKSVPILKGVNLTPWCKKKFGNDFKAKLIRRDAGGWTCEQSAGNRRPVSVTGACKLQYGNRAYKSVALNKSDPYSWKCVLRHI